MKEYFKFIILMLLGCQASSISGQALFANFNEPVPLDESISYGKLDNGMSYYIKPLPESQDKVNLHFYVKVGRNHQDSDQFNVAHFVEHMAFKASKNFPNGIFYETKTNKSLEMNNNDINGTAGSRISRYNFDAPADNKEALDTGLLWFKDIANGLSFKKEEIDSERGVMVQENIFRNSDMEEYLVKNKILAHMIPCVQNVSNFKEHHETLDAERLKQFYKDWYRPELMAIVIAGEIDDVDALERQIISQFSEIPLKENPRKQPTCGDSFFNRPPQFMMAEKESETKASDPRVEMELLFRDKKTLEILSSKEGVKRMNEIDLFIEIVNNRMREAKGYGSFFNILMLHTFKKRSTPSSFQALLTSYKNSQKQALQIFTRELEQIRRHGVTESEFSNAKQNRIDQLEKTEVDKSRYWINEIGDYITYGKALPSNKTEIIRKWLSDYGRSEFNEFIKGVDFDMPDIGMMAPTNHPALSIKEEEIRSWIHEVKEGVIKPYVKPEAPINLMSTSEVKKLQEYRYENKGIGESGAREINLANGVKVFLKSFKPSSGIYQKKVMLHGFSKRGALDFPVKDYFSAINAPRIIRHSGVGDFDKFDLERYLSTSSFSILTLNPYVENLESGIKVNADLVDVEKMLQLVYLLFSQPRKDSLAFEDWRFQEEQRWQKYARLEQIDFFYNIRKFIRDDSEVSRGTERQHGLEKTDMEKGFEIYNDLFRNAQDFTFTISGDFPMDVMLPLINRYLGNLPSFQPNINLALNRNDFAPKPSGPVFTQFKFPESYTKTNYMYWPKYIISAEDQEDWKEKLLVSVIGRLLNSKVWALRTEKGYALYTVNAYGKYDINMNHFEFSADFNCTPEEYPLLRQEFSDIVIELKSGLIPEDVLKKTVQELQELFQRRMKNHRYIHEKLYDHRRFGESWTNEEYFIQYLETLRPEDILKAAQKYFKNEHLYEFVMMD